MWTQDELNVLQDLSKRLQSGFENLPEFQTAKLNDSVLTALSATTDRLHENYPYQHPLYLGQMLKPPHPIARMAYALAMTINPNNHALDGGLASSRMEIEAVQKIAAMFGWEDALGHLCGGGTIANFEALWVAREMTGGKAIAASSQAHYTHSRLSGVLQVPFVPIAVDSQGRMDLHALEAALKDNQIGTVVVTLGTTGIGSVDPLREILALRERYDFRVHVDAAYGGYFKLVDSLSPQTASAYEQIHHADSIVIDPHKHGLQPYGCGCVLFRDRRAVAVYQHESPYTYFTSDELHLGEISLECSRAGASAVALWATLEAFPLCREGEFARNLTAGRSAALELYHWLKGSPVFTPVLKPELDLVVWSFAAQSASEADELANEFFTAAAQQDLHLALVTLPESLLRENLPIPIWDRTSIRCLRATVMKSAHQEWMPEILRRMQLVVKQMFDGK